MADISWTEARSEGYYFETFWTEGLGDEFFKKPQGQLDFEWHHAFMTDKNLVTMDASATRLIFFFPLLPSHNNNNNNIR